MRIRMPHPAAGAGHVDLIGNPIIYSDSPISYRRAPPLCGADTKETICEPLGEAAYSEACDEQILEQP